DQIKQSLEGIKGAKTKLKTLIGRLIHLYITNRVFAKIILLEVRNFPGYFESETYEKAKEYSRLILDLIKEGMKKGEIRDDVSPSSFRQVILGGMEHLILPAIIFNLEVDPDSLSDDLFKIIFHE
ncbi:MAG: TetR/AcrR family transcriptional regulator C-terminal domain-containing protein, partial [Pseudomonadota bacterium]